MAAKVFISYRRADSAGYAGRVMDRLDRDLTRAMRWNEKIRNSADFHEGLSAFLEKRDPVWPGRKLN